MKIKRLIINTIIAILLLLILFPVIWIVINSFKTDIDIITNKFFFVPTLSGYRAVLSTARLLTGLENSVIVTSGSLALGFLAGVPLAYIFARFNFWNREGFKFMVASLRFIPPVVLVVPFLNIWLSTGLYDTQVSLIITYFTITAATMIWLCIEVFNSVEMHLEEAASIDGCSPFQVFYKVALPIALPGVLAMLIFTFILVWNEFFMAFILTLTRAFTLPVAVTTSIGYGPWGYISAMIVLLSIPPVLFSYVIMRFLPYYYRT